MNKLALPIILILIGSLVWGYTCLPNAVAQGNPKYEIYEHINEQNSNFYTNYPGEVGKTLFYNFTNSGNVTSDSNWIKADAFAETRLSCTSGFPLDGRASIWTYKKRGFTATWEGGGEPQANYHSWARFSLSLDPRSPISYCTARGKWESNWYLPDSQDIKISWAYTPPGYEKRKEKSGTFSQWYPRNGYYFITIIAYAFAESMLDCNSSPHMSMYSGRSQDVTNDVERMCTVYSMTP